MSNNSPMVGIFALPIALAKTGAHRIDHHNVTLSVEDSPPGYLALPGYLHRINCNPLWAHDALCNQIDEDPGPPL